MNPQQEITKFLIYHFSTEELTQLSTHLVRNTQDLETIQDRKKQVMADFTAKIKAAEAEIFKAARLIGNGYEYRDVKCSVVFDEPRKAMKRIIRQDTGEVVAEEPMAADELQYALDLDLQAAKEEIKAEAVPESKPAPEPEPQPEPASFVQSDDDAPFGEEEPTRPLAEPVRITCAKEGGCAQIIILDTLSGFQAEASIELKGEAPIPVEIPGVFLSEEACRSFSARKVWNAAERADNQPGARRKALRAIMAWAKEQMGGNADAQ